MSSLGRVVLRVCPASSVDQFIGSCDPVCETLIEVTQQFVTCVIQNRTEANSVDADMVDCCCSFEMLLWVIPGRFYPYLPVQQ